MLKKVLLFSVGVLLILILMILYFKGNYNKSTFTINIPTGAKIDIDYENINGILLTKDSEIISEYLNSIELVTKRNIKLPNETSDIYIKIYGVENELIYDLGLYISGYLWNFTTNERYVVQGGYEKVKEFSVMLDNLD